MITNKFIHIHVPRTGGTSTRNFLFNFCKGKEDIKIYDRRFHLTLELSKEIANKRGNIEDVPSFCLIRNPWDWYVSAFSFLSRGRIKRVNGSVNSHESRNANGFREFIRFLKERNDGVDDHKRYLWRYWLKRFKTYGECFYELTEGGVDYVGRFENMHEDISEILMKFDIPELTENIIMEELPKKRAHRTKHAPYREMYDDESREIVAEIEKKFIEEFNYEF